MPADGATLEHTLHIESEALAAFIALLREEQQAIVRGKLDRLCACAESKSICLFELSRLGEQRLEWLRKRGLTANRAGMEQLLREQAGATSQARDTWRKVLDLTQTAQQLNDTNGGLIGSRLSGTQRALGVLFSTSNIGGAYTSNGSTVCLRPAQTLAVA
ncbi:MAG: flagellar protein FlgN [Betaproteobacteria bacterium]|nr:flagellar protein FlgN [Betaproteobacteria bacterium]